MAAILNQTDVKGYLVVDNTLIRLLKDLLKFVQ